MYLLLDEGMEGERERERWLWRGGIRWDRVISLYVWMGGGTVTGEKQGRMGGERMEMSVCSIHFRLYEGNSEQRPRVQDRALRPKVDYIADPDLIGLICSPETPALRRASSAVATLE